MYFKVLVALFHVLYTLFILWFPYIMSKEALHKITTNKTIKHLNNSQNFLGHKTSVKTGNQKQQKMYKSSI